MTNRFEGKIVSERFKKLIKACATASPELNFFFSKKELMIQAKHSSNAKLIEANIKSEAFEKFKCNTNFLIKIDIVNVIKLLSYMKLPNSILDIKIDESYIIFDGEKYNLKSKLIDSSLENKFTLPDERKPTDEKPALTFSYEIEINATELSEKVKSSNSIFDVVTLDITNDKLIIKSNNELGEFSATIDNINYKKFKENCISKFSAPDLISFVEKLKEKITFKCGKHLPLKIEKQIFPFAEIKFLLAPMVDIDE